MATSRVILWAGSLAATMALGPTLDAPAQSVKPLPKLPGPEAAVVEITRATVTPSEAAPGAALRVAAVVKSTGGPSGPFSVLLKLDGRELGRQAGDLGTGAERTFTFPTPAPDRAAQVCYDLDLQAGPGNRAAMKGDSRACLKVMPQLAERLPSTPGSPRVQPGGPTLGPKVGQGDPTGAPKVSAPGVVALKLDGSVSAQEAEQHFKTLPDDARIQLKDGRILTKRELIADHQRKREAAQARLKKSDGGGGGANFAAIQSQFKAKQDAELAQARAQLQAQVQRLAAEPEDAGPAPKELESIRAEALQLRKRYAQASAAEKTQIDARVQILMSRAKQLLGQ
jgi:hypothetical protein